MPSLEVEIIPVEGRRYARVHIRQDDKPTFVGIMDFSPNGHFGLAVGKRLLEQDNAAILFIDRDGLWTRQVTHVDCVHVTDNGVVAFLDAGCLVVADMNGDIFAMDTRFGPPCFIDEFSVGSDGFHLRAGHTTWRADHQGNLTRLA